MSAKQTPNTASRLSGEPKAGNIVARQTPGPARPETTAKAVLDLGSVLTSVGETAYRWDLGDDRMVWAANAPDVLGITGFEAIATGAAFHLHMACEHAGRRIEMLAADRSSETAEGGIPYRVQFRFLPDGRRGERTIWIEDQGRWFSRGPDRPGEVVGLLRVIDDRREAEKHLKYLSDHDPVTGLINRTRLTEAISSSTANAQRHGHSFAFLLAAVDNLALTNEAFGFAVGDDVICSVGRRLRSFLRDGDVIGRYSANKFGIIVNDCHRGTIKSVAERLMHIVSERPIETGSCRLSASVSIGGVIVPEHAASVQQVTACALEALDDAKARHLNSFCSYARNPGRVSRRNKNIRVAEEIVAALDEERMRIAFQPIVRTEGLEPALYECLLRMQQPDGKLVSAGDFMPLAEKLGLSRLVDTRVLELAVARLKSDHDINLTVNVSGLTAINHDWLVTLDRLTGGNRQLTNRIVVEITETAAIQDLDESVIFVDALKELGCRVAIDDFGAGSTSFRNLRYLGVDMVKIDGSFFTDLSTNSDSRVFVEKLSEIANHFGMETVAEWVGDEVTADIVRSIGITYMQGYLFGKAQFAEAGSEADIAASGLRPC